MLIRVTHQTVFDYTADVGHSVMEVRLTPLMDEGQTVREHALMVTPRTQVFAYRDYFGNTVQTFSVGVQHRRLEIISRCLVDTHRDRPPQATEEPWAGTLFEYLRFGGPVTVRPELAVMADAARSTDPLRQLNNVNQLVYNRLTYTPKSTTVQSTLDDVLDGGEGVCQDFAHLMLGVCRQLEVPARYVSGYVLTNHNGAVRGTDASHAWCECYVPDSGWIGCDPTNNLLVDDRYVAIARGRDYRDVPPTKGVYRGAGEEVMTVAVHTERA